MTRHVLLSATLFSLVSVPAVAYVISGGSVLERFAEVEATLHAVGSPLVGTAHVAGSSSDWPVRIDLARSGCRASIQTPQGAASASLAGGRVSSQGASLPALTAFVTLACPLLMRDVSSEEAEKAATQFADRVGIKLGISSLSMVDGRAGWVIGARPHDERRPQLWIDKETGRPLRVVGEEGDHLWDIHLLESDSIATNRLGPREVSIRQHGEHVLELRLMAQNPRLSGHETTVEMPESDDE